MEENWISVRGRIVRGHQVASKPSEHYPRGTIEMQLPFFRSLGLDLGAFHPATLNVSIAPYRYGARAPEHTFRGVRWTSEHPPEDFSFSACRIEHKGVERGGWIYYPHPETKERHFQNPSIIEIIAPHIPGVEYGDEVAVKIKTAEITPGGEINV